MCILHLAKNRTLDPDDAILFATGSAPLLKQPHLQINVIAGWVVRGESRSKCFGQVPA